MQRTEYKEVFAISQSSIKAYKTKPLQKFKEIYIDNIERDEDESKYAFGSLTDTLAFEPKLLDERFYIVSSEVGIPGEKVKIVLDKVYREASEMIENKKLLNASGNLPEQLYIPYIGDIGEFQELIYKHAKETGLGGTTWKRDQIFNKVFEDRQYFQMLSECKGRQVITPLDNVDAIELVANLQKTPETAPYFVQQENETLLFQQEIFTDYITVNGIQVPVKGAIDIIRLKHDDKTAQVADLKTTHNLAEFLKIVRNFDYAIQGSFYCYLLRRFLETYEKGKYKDYRVILPVNCAIDREYKMPQLFNYRKSDLDIVEFGSDAHLVKGWKQIIEEISFHLQTGIWDKPREMYEKGSITLKIYP